MSRRQAMSETRRSNNASDHAMVTATIRAQLVRSES
jgi:hypothetical protein